MGQVIAVLMIERSWSVVRRSAKDRNQLQEGGLMNSWPIEAPTNLGEEEYKSLCWIDRWLFQRPVSSFESFPAIVESRTINYHHPTIWESLKAIEMEFQTIKASKILCPKHQYGLTAVDDSHSFGVCRGAVLWKFAGMIIIMIMIMVVSKQIPALESKDEQESLTLSSQMSRKVYSTQRMPKDKMR
jgi:hypothetical protein